MSKSLVNSTIVLLRVFPFIATFGYANSKHLLQLFGIYKHSEARIGEATNILNNQVSEREKVCYFFQHTPDANRLCLYCETGN